MNTLIITNGEKIFSNLFKNSTVGMSITTLDGHLHTNDAFCKLLGYSREELTNRSWTDFTHPDDILYNKIVIDNILSGIKQSDRWEKRYIHKDGSIIWVDIHTLLHRDEEGKPLHFITTINDISKRRTFEVALSESEERFTTLIRQMNEGIAITDLDGVCLFGNPALENILGLEKNSLSGQNFKDIFGVGLFQKMLDEIKRYNYGEQNIFEIEFRLANGTRKVLSGCATPRDTVEIFFLIRDITEQKRAEEEIRLQNEQLRISHAEKDKFFAILAHDLRSPLSSFLGLTEIMAEDINDMTMSEIEEISKSLYLSASNLFQLLENLLEWSILKGGNSVCIPEYYSLKRLINKSMEPVLESARRKNIRINIDLEQSFQVYCDIRMTETIFRNIISNAIKFTHNNGSISITAIPDQNARIIVSVCDTGIGMNEEALSSLFHLNEQINRKGTHGETSSGLGLLICKEFTEKQGGKIWAESDEGKGSTFYFTLKLSE